MSCALYPAGPQPDMKRQVINMNSLPEPVRAVLAHLPQYPASAAFAALITLLFKEQLGATALPELAGRRVRLRVSDMGIALTFRSAPDGFVPCGGQDADVTLTATAQDFLQLALRREDPDTLFFARRLCMEGDTELGLLVKNTLDALDPAAQRIRLPTPAAVFRLLRTAIFDPWSGAAARPDQPGH